MSEAEYHVSSAVVYCTKEHITAVIDKLAEVPNLEVHGFHPEGRIVITLEGEDKKQISDHLEHIAKLPHVMSSSLVYHQFEPANEEVS